MEWIDSKVKEPPKYKKILAVIDFCGQKRINVVKFVKYTDEWRTDMQLNTINKPLFWQKLPQIP